jgi:4-cresol dehydrogenase (hydroxylating)
MTTDPTTLEPARSRSPELLRALERLASALGAPHVIASQDEVARRARDTSWADSAPAAIVTPGTTEEVQAVVRIARELGVALWPYSAGKNWGYGGSRPLTDQSIAVSLERMNRIIEHDEELAYVVLEAGVTFRQLYHHLRDRSSRLWCSPTDGPPDGSVIGNALDRGVGSTPYGDHFANLCGIQVVLPDGTVAERGASGPGARTHYTHRFGLGPYTDALFAQSNYGIVTRAGVWLMPAPEQTLAFVLQGDEDRLPPMIDALRRLGLSETVRSRVRVLNPQGLFGYFDGVAGRVAPGRRSDDELAGLRREHGLACWSMIGAVYGTAGEVRAHRAAIARELRGLGKLRFIRPDRVARLEAVLRRIERAPRVPLVRRGIERVVRAALGASLDVLRVQPHLLRLWQGVPTERNVAFAYGRSGRAAPATDLDPARDGCGKVWFSPLVPMTGRDVSQVLRIGDALFRRHGFDFNVYMISINARSIVALMMIVYSRTLPGEEARARELYAELRTRVRDLGYEQYRVALWSMPDVLDAAPGHRHLARTIKAALDPDGVLAPGKYGL